MFGTCPCSKTVKCRRSKYGWLIPRHAPNDASFGHPYKYIGQNNLCVKSGSLRFRKDGSQTMLGGVITAGHNNQPVEIRSHVSGDHSGTYEINPATGIYEPVPIS